VILTLTPNPTIDRALFVRGFEWGAAVRAEREVVTPSGKGVDASLVLHELGGETVALGLNAGLTGQLLAAMLDEWGIFHDFCAAEGETRTATVLVDLERGEQSTISASSLRAPEDALSALCDAMDRYANRAWGLICGGSLPPGLAPNAYARLVRHARGLGWTTLLDTSGEALRQGVSGMPHVLKVNRAELAALVVSPSLGKLALSPPKGTEGSNPNVGEDGTSLADRLSEHLGVWASEAIVVTLGEQGALAVTREGMFCARPPCVPVTNTAGAGDALNAGLMLARSRRQSWPDALALGAAAAASVLMNEGTAVCQREQVAGLVSQVKVERCSQGARRHR
jgi:1-phosphofructokinase family hexose kinase